jgi:glycosyltransferase involved in cell wall biosynthesis
MTLVEVLLSTYNGERHLREQVDSILAQRGVDVRLVVRDDESRDGTLEVLASYADEPRVRVRAGGRNLGLPQAFFELLENSRDDAEMWALADQDDVWLSHKLLRAAAALEAVDGPAMYCARVLVSDEDLRPLYAHALPLRGPSFENALVQNIATGCTIVLNRAARDVLRGRWPDYAVMHDAWLYAVLSGCGTVVYDPEVVVRYRQHGANAVGMGRGRVARVGGRIRRQLAAGGAGAHGRQNAELLRTHHDTLRPWALNALDALHASRRSVCSRLAYAVKGPAHRQTVGSTLVVKILHALNRT